MYLWGSNLEETAASVKKAQQTSAKIQNDLDEYKSKVKEVQELINEYGTTAAENFNTVLGTLNNHLVQYGRRAETVNNLIKKNVNAIKTTLPLHQQVQELYTKLENIESSQETNAKQKDIDDFMETIRMDFGRIDDIIGPTGRVLGSDDEADTPKTLSEMISSLMSKYNLVLSKAIRHDIDISDLKTKNKEFEEEMDDAKNDLQSLKDQEEESLGSEVNDSLEQMTKRFDNLNQDFDNKLDSAKQEMEDMLAEIKSSIVSEDSFQHFKEQINDLQTKMEPLEKSVEKVRTKVEQENLQGRSLGSDVKTSLEEMTTSLGKLKEDLDKKLDTTEMQTINANIVKAQELASQVNDFQDSLEEITTSLGILKEFASTLEEEKKTFATIDNLETKHKDTISQTENLLINAENTINDLFVSHKAGVDMEINSFKTIAATKEGLAKMKDQYDKGLDRLIVEINDVIDALNANFSGLRVIKHELLIPIMSHSQVVIENQPCILSTGQDRYMFEKAGKVRMKTFPPTIGINYSIKLKGNKIGEITENVGWLTFDVLVGDELAFYPMDTYNENNKKTRLYVEVYLEYDVNTHMNASPPPLVIKES